MVIRSMSLGELVPAEFIRVVWKEMRVGLAMGALLGAVIALQVHFFLPAEYFGEASVTHVAAVVGLSLTAQITFSTLIGAALPLGAQAVRLDPAVVASPAITTFVDVTGSIIYFLLARALLGVG
jgi:magnesium transporter